MALPPLDSLELDELLVIVDHIDEFSPEEQAEIQKIIDTLSDRAYAASCHDDLIAFCCHMQPDYKVGKHHRILANLLMEIAEGKKDRIFVNIPPRHGKSQLVSIFFPAWFIGS